MRNVSSVNESTFIAELGLRRSLVDALTLKTLFYLGEASIHELAKQMCISRAVADQVFQRLRREELVHATGMAAVGGVHHVTLTGAGRARAVELLQVDQYVGPAPVTLEDYVKKIHAQSVRDLEVGPEDVHRAFRHLVIDENVLAQLGTAVISGRAIFLYGPPGTGKTTVAETLAEIFRETTVLIPHAIDVDGQTITVYDSHVHERVDDDVPVSDPRWVTCRRPCAVVGGELTIDMLDLQFNPISKFYTAPVQMRANNGVLIIDDFGRQRVHPDELLNRWVVPLDRRIDYLTLAGGKKLQIPFDLFVVFATNLDPATVIEEAFLRRIQTKILLEGVAPEQFHEIAKGVCAKVNVEYDGAVIAHLMHLVLDEFQQPLRACYPRDLIYQIAWRAQYEQRPPELTIDAIEEACQAYFIQARRRIRDVEGDRVRADAPVSNGSSPIGPGIS